MNSISRQLHQKGYRSTGPRQQILSVLTTFPQSVAEVMTALMKHGATINRVTVYRTLNCFVDLGWVSKTQFQDKTAKYELVTNAGHHHHLVCNGCGAVENIALNESYLLSAVRKHSDFQVVSHSLEFFGLCAHCR